MFLEPVSDGAIHADVITGVLVLDPVGGPGVIPV
jgi:hypothetical protein